MKDQDWPKIRQVVVEVHPVGDRVIRACELLQDRGFNVSTQVTCLLHPGDGVCSCLERVYNRYAYLEGEMHVEAEECNLVLALSSTVYGTVVWWTRWAIPSTKANEGG